MKRDEAQRVAARLREAGWDVTAAPSPLQAIGWELRGKPAERAKTNIALVPYYVFSGRAMELLIGGGRIARLNASAAEPVGD